MNKQIFIIPLLFYLLASCGECPVDPQDSQRYYVDSSLVGEWLDTLWVTPRDTLDYSAYLCQPFMFNDNIIFAYDSRVHCVNKKTGATVWIAKTESAIGTYTPQQCDELISDGRGGIIYITRDFVECLALSDGMRKWRVDAENSAAFSSLVNSKSCSGTHLFVSYRGRFDNRDKDQGIWAIDKSSGTVLWKTQLYTNDTLVDTWSTYPSGTVYHNGYVYVGTREYPGYDGNNYGGTLFCLNAFNGSITWKRRMPGPGNDIQFYERWDLMKSGTILQQVIPTDDGIIAFAGYYLVKVDYQGNIVWRKGIVHDRGSMSEGSKGNPHVSDGLIYMVNAGKGDHAFMYAYDIATETIRWQSHLDHREGTSNSRSVYLDGNRVYTVTDAGRIAVFDKFTGRMEWQSSLNYVLPKGRWFENCLFGYMIEGDKVYFITANHLVCAQRKKKS